MGDPEWRGARRVLVLTTVAVLAAAFAIYLLLLPAPLEVLTAFVVSFVVGIVIDLVILKRRFRPRR